MTVIASDLVDRLLGVASVDDLWEPSTLFLPNWETPIRLGTSYKTIIKESRSVAEQRLALTEKPRRSMTYAFRGYDAVASEQLRAVLARGARAVARPDLA